MKHRTPAPHGRHRGDLSAGLHRAPDERGRHRAAEHPLRHGRHRAPADITERGRMAVAAALVAGVGVAGGATLDRDGVPTDDTTVALGSHDRTASTNRSDRENGGTGAAGGPAAATGAAAAADRKRTVPVKTAQKKPAPKKKAPKKKAAPNWVDPMPQGRVTSCYGQRWGRLHAGVDLAAPSGTPVRAAGAGRVRSAGSNYGGYGISVLIAHDNGYLTHYAHLSSTSVDDGERVSAGEMIGREGSTGNSTGPHLHFEVHKGTWRNTVEPTDWLRDRGVDVGC